jgi:queuine tRNA-ribosyltransferase
MEVQAALGAEIAMAFDECPPGGADLSTTRESVELTARWATRSKLRFYELQGSGADLGAIGERDGQHQGLNGRQALFGIVQGAGHLDLRRESLLRTTEIGFDGYAIGGLSVGEEKSIMYDVVEHIAPMMPEDAPRYLMGVGTPEDLIQAVWHGVDMFDCVIPTRNGRTGSAFTSRGKVNIRNARYVTDARPLDPACGCSVCIRYSRAYLRHMYQSGEMLAAVLISHHNLAFFLDTMRRVRQAIRLGKFAVFKQDLLSDLSQEPE